MAKKVAKSAKLNKSLSTGFKGEQKKGLRVQEDINRKRKGMSLTAACLTHGSINQSGFLSEVRL